MGTELKTENEATIPNSLKELRFTFFSFSLTVEWHDGWLEKGTITLDRVEIGKLQGAGYNPSVKQYSTWKVRCLPETFNSETIEGNFRTCMSYAAGHFLMIGKKINHFHK